MSITRSWRVLDIELSLNTRAFTHTFTHIQIHISAITHLSLHPSTFMHTHNHKHIHNTQTRPTQVNTSPSFSAATVNVKQQNLNMANENIGSCVILLLSIFYCICHSHAILKSYFSYNWRLSTGYESPSIFYNWIICQKKKKSFLTLNFNVPSCIGCLCVLRDFIFTCLICFRALLHTCL